MNLRRGHPETANNGNLQMSTTRKVLKSLASILKKTNVVFLKMFPTYLFTQENLYIGTSND